MTRSVPARLAAIDPIEIAHDVSARVAADYAEAARALGALEVPCLSEAQRVHTPVFQRARALASYAVWGETLRHPEIEVGWLTALLHLRPLRRGEPHSPIEAVILGARARMSLTAREPLSAAQLALLSGCDRDHVLSMAADLPGAYRSDEPRRPWRFPVSRALLRWLAARETTAQRAAQRVA